jgi:dUTP pyrophosphatase
MQNVRYNSTMQCQTIVSTLTLHSLEDPFIIAASIQEENHMKHTTTTFIDLGAMGNFIHKKEVERLGLTTESRDSPLRLQTVMGQGFYNVTWQVTLHLMIQDHTETITLNMAGIRKHRIILGLPWCSHHSVQFNWKNQIIASWGMECEEEGHLFTSVATLETEYLRVKPTMDTPPPPPVQATPESVGYNLHAATTLEIPSHTRALIATGYSMATPEGTYRRIAPRSGLALKHSIDITTGVIDPDYRGEVKVLMVNNRSQTYTVQSGERIAQLILERVETPDILVTDNFEETERQEGGFGSMGMVRRFVAFWVFLDCFGWDRGLCPI